MRLPLLLPAALLTVLFPAAALAQGAINLSWDQCGSSGTGSKSFACNANSGSPFVLISSFSLSAPVADVLEYVSVIEVTFDDALVPLWWQVAPLATECRPSAFDASLDFSSHPPNCQDFFQNNGSTIEPIDNPFGAPNRIRIRILTGLAEAVTIPAGVEIYAHRTTLSRARSTGAGSCAGCGIGACLQLQRIELIAQGSGLVATLTAPIQRSHVAWQAGTPSCGGATPAQRGTWGRVKAFYR